MSIDPDLIRYTYDSGSIKAFRLVVKCIHNDNDIEKLEYVCSNMIKELDRDMSAYEAKFKVKRP